MRGPILQGQTGKTRTAAKIEDILVRRRGERACGRQRVTRQNDAAHLFGSAQGGEVHVLIPAGEQVETHADEGKQGVIQVGEGDEGRKQFAQDGGFHSE